MRYSSIYEDAMEGDEIQQTIDLATATGYVLLVNSDYDIVKKMKEILPDYISNNSKYQELDMLETN